MSEKVFRFYQRDAIENTQFSLSEHPRTLGRLGTGGGKTAIAAGVAKDEVAIGGRVLYLADQDELCFQPRRAMREFAGIIPALEKADTRASLEAEIVVASSQTLSRKKNLERFPKDHFSLVVVDEAHRALERDLGIIETFEGARSLFLTATPYRKGLSSLAKWIPDIAFDIPLKKNRKSPPGTFDLIEMGFAPPLRIAPVSIALDLEEVSRKRGDYDAEDLETKLLPYFDEIADQLKTLAAGYSTIAFLPMIATSREFARILQSHGIAARHVDGSSPDRREIIAAFGEGHFQVLCNADVLSTGVDIPRADCLLDLSPTTSMARLEQRIGRVSRVLPGVVDHLPERADAEERRALIAASAKPHALLLEVLCSGEKARASALIADDAKEAEEIAAYAAKLKSPEEIEELAKKFRADKEARLIAAMEKAAAQREKNLIPAEWVGNLLGDPSLDDWETTHALDLVAASDAQLKLLLQFGVQPDTVQDKGHAKKLISAILPRFNQKMASLQQVLILRKMRVPHPHTFTRKQAAERMSNRHAARRFL